MAYTWITTGVDTITSDVMQDNFTALFDGDVMPRTAVTIGGAMTATHDAFKLGNSTNSWNNLYCKTIHSGSDIKARESLWQEQFYIMLSAVTAEIKITAPDSDFSEYMINIYSEHKTASSIQSIEMQFNSLTGYGQQVLVHQFFAGALGVKTATAIRATSTTKMTVSAAREAAGTSNVGFKQFVNAHVFTEAGFFRLIRSKYGCWDDTGSQICSMGHIAHTWGDVSTVITSFNFAGDFHTGTVFEMQMRV